MSLQAVELTESEPQAGDSLTYAFYLETEPEQVVLLQTLIESYEGLAAVRTVGMNPPTICVMCTAGTLEPVKELLTWFIDNKYLTLTGERT